MAAKNTTKEMIGYGMCNPVTRKMAYKAQEARENGVIIQEATYAGIVKKCLYFLGMVAVGVVLYFIADLYFTKNADLYGGFLEIEGESGVMSTQITLPIVAIFLVCGIIALFLPLLAWLIRPTIPVTGTLYSICEGFTAASIAGFLAPEYKWIALVAMLLTIALVLTMLLLFTNRVIRVTSTVRKIISVSFFTMVFGGIVIAILSFVPVIGPQLRKIMEFMNSPVIGIISSVLYIVIAALFLLVDFDTIEKCVEEKMPKKYEWMAAFGLVYTVIYIYFKILNVIIQIVEASKNN